MKKPKEEHKTSKGFLEDLYIFLEVTKQRKKAKKGNCQNTSLVETYCVLTTSILKRLTKPVGQI